MSVTGNWTLNYDWGCTGSYSTTSMTIDANGTWTNGQGYSGVWVQAAGMLTFKFNNINRQPCQQVGHWHSEHLRWIKRLLLSVAGRRTHRGKGSSRKGQS